MQDLSEAAIALERIIIGATRKGQPQARCGGCGAEAQPLLPPRKNRYRNVYQKEFFGSDTKAVLSLCKSCGHVSVAYGNDKSGDHYRNLTTEEAKRLRSSRSWDGVRDHIDSVTKNLIG